MRRPGGKARERADSTVPHGVCPFQTAPGHSRRPGLPVQRRAARPAGVRTEAERRWVSQDAASVSIILHNSILRACICRARAGVLRRTLSAGRSLHACYCRRGARRRHKGLHACHPPACSRLGVPHRVSIRRRGGAGGPPEPVWWHRAGVPSLSLISSCAPFPRPRRYGSLLEAMYEELCRGGFNDQHPQLSSSEQFDPRRMDITLDI